MKKYKASISKWAAHSFDGSKAIIGKEEFLIDEALITEVTELPSTREKWFKTTKPKERWNSCLTLSLSIEE